MKWLKRWWSTLIQFGFRLLYNELAWTYDAVAWLVSLGQWRRWQLASLKFLHQPTAGHANRLLEIGHGPGHMLLEGARRGFAVSGCDLSPFMGRQAQRRLRSHGQSANLVRAAVPQLPFADGVFSVILSHFPTAYILQEETAAAVYRLLKPGGRLIIVPEGHLTGRSPVHRLIAWLFWVTGQTGAGDFADPAQEHEVILAEMWRPWIHRYEAAGFGVEIHDVKLSRSACTVLVADKPDCGLPLLSTDDPESGLLNLC